MDNKEKLRNDLRVYILDAINVSVKEGNMPLQNSIKAFPFESYSSIISEIFEINDVDKLVVRLKTKLDKFEKVLTNFGQSKQALNTNGVKDFIYNNDLSIFQIFNILKIKISLPQIVYPKIYKITKCEYHQDFVKPGLIMISLLRDLGEKLKNFIHLNSLEYNGISYSTYSIKNLNKLDDDEKLEAFDHCFTDAQKVLNKSYYLDILSSGRHEVCEIAGAITEGLYALSEIIPVATSSNYYDQNDEIVNPNKIINDLIKSHYIEIDSIVRDENFLNKYNEEDLVNIAIKINQLDNGNHQNKANPFQELGVGELKLSHLIGLTNVKESIEKIKAYSISNKDSKDLNLHMAFYGNPGTGKTEVARIIAQILYENKILPTKKVVEVSRKDLVGMYVGETPLKTENVIDNAMGGVLFIDEAYSLVPEDFPSDYGHEAVATLIKAMEDNRGKFVVILAGYKNKLTKMIDSNPGFKSRIQFHLDFKNYDRNELKKIAELILKEKDYKISEEAITRLLDITDSMRKSVNFANARTIRSILEQTIMNQNLRVLDVKNKNIELEDIDKYIKDSNLKIATSDPNDNTTKILSGLEQLDTLIGLSDVKLMVKKIFAFAKHSKKLNSDQSFHMVFKGNPGTGKTEVARIISTILYEAGVLKEAKFLETDASGLISKFVGETATKTKEIINEAMGGVLFIDEAYALALGDGNASYGQEAIAALIKEMEDNRGNLVVILAGYKDEMDKLLESNPGFKSRIPFELDFPDYNKEELLLIAKKMLNDQKMIMSDDALERLYDVILIKQKESGYANARTVRTLINEAIMTQCLRIELSDNSESDNKIIYEDIEALIKDDHLDIPAKVDLNGDNEHINSDILDEINEAKLLPYNSLEINNAYIESAVISISGNGQGSGFVISPKGLALTCAHCIENGGMNQKARVTINIPGQGKMPIYLTFKLLKIDTFNDIALIRLNSQDFIFKFLRLGDNDDSYYNPLHEFIMAGFPFGGETYNSISITDGKVASVNHIDNRLTVFANMFGKPGNSGSPIIDKTDYNVIGIFWGGISRGNEMIKCFTPLSSIYNLLKGE